jgi:ferredoxin, 2Fe-2S
MDYTDNLTPSGERYAVAQARTVAGIVRVKPLGVDLVLGPGESLIEAAWREGYYWPTVCFGQASCTACNVEVCEGFDYLSDVSVEETRALEKLRATHIRNPASRRLACRLEVHGRVVVQKQGVRSSQETVRGSP